MKYLKLFEAEEFYLIDEVKKYITDDLTGDYYFKLLSWDVDVKLDNNKIVIDIEVTEPYDDGMNIIYPIRINPGNLMKYFQGVVDSLKDDFEKEFENVTIEDDEEHGTNREDKFFFTIKCYLVEHLSRSADILWSAKLKK